MILQLLVSSALGVRFGQPQGQTRQLGLTPAACLAKMRQLELENAQLKKRLERVRYAESRQRGNTLIKGPLNVFPQWPCIPLHHRVQYNLGNRIVVAGYDAKEAARDFGLIGAIKKAAADPDKNRKLAFLNQSTVSKAQIAMQIQDLLRFRAGGSAVWTKDIVEILVAEVKAGRDISCSDYGGSHSDVELAMRLHGVAGKRLMVAGSISPWVESIALALGCTNITTSDYNPPESQHPNLEVISVPTLLHRLYSAGDGASVSADLEQQADIVFSYSSVEHDGLGRYGDPLNPEGDFHAMKELYDMTRPGGVLMVAVPCLYQDRLAFESARMYGPVRLPMLVTQDRWQYLGSVSGGEYHAEVQLAQENCAYPFAHQPIIMLRRVPKHELHLKRTRCTINCTDVHQAAKMPSSQVQGAARAFVCKPSSDCESPLMPQADNKRLIEELEAKVPQIKPACPPHECSADGQWKGCAAGTRKWPAEVVKKWL